MTVYRMTFSDGQTVETSGYGVVGRNPQLHALDDELDHAKDVTLVTVPDFTKSVSRVHFAFGQFDGAFWVSDVDSGNGTTLVYPDGSSFVLDPGVRYEVDPGSRIDFGNFHVTVDEVGAGAHVDSGAESGLG